MSSLTPMSEHELNDLIQRIKTMRVAELKDILRSMNITPRGIKKDHYDDILNIVKRAVSTSDNVKLITLKIMTLKLMLKEPLPNFNAIYTAISNGSLNHQDVYNSLNNRPSRPLASYGTKQKSKPGDSSVPNYRHHGSNLIHHKNQSNSQPVYSFRPSPFYKVIESIYPGPQIGVGSSSREEVELGLEFTDDQISLLRKPNYRVFFFCAKHESTRKDGLCITLPAKYEILVNGQHFKDSIRGIKNEPDSARPGDITNCLYLTGDSSNRVRFAFIERANFYVMCNIVEKILVETIIKNINLDLIPMSQTIQEIQQDYQKNNDDDIEVDRIRLYQIKF